MTTLPDPAKQPFIEFDPRTEPPRLVTTKSDHDVAEDLKLRCAEALKSVLSIMQEAAQSNMTINWNLGADQFGRFQVVNINVVKHL